MLRLLRKKETVGLNVKQEDVCNLPIIISNGHIPSIYNHNASLPFARNHPDIDYTSLRVCEESGSIPGMSQYENIHNNEDDDDFIPFNHFDRTEEESSDRMVSPYSFLIASFKELTSIMDGNCEKNDIIHVHSFIHEQIGAFKNKISIEQNLIPTTGPSTYISSNVLSSKKRKTHGQNKF